MSAARAGSGSSSDSDSPSASVCRRSSIVSSVVNPIRQCRSFVVRQIVRFIRSFVNSSIEHPHTYTQIKVSTKIPPKKKKKDILTLFKAFK